MRTTCRNSRPLKGILIGTIIVTHGVLAAGSPGGYKIAAGLFSEWEAAPTAFPFGTASGEVPFPVPLSKL